METTRVHQGMIIMHLGVMDTVFHSGDRCMGLYAIKFSVEDSTFFVQNGLNIFLCLVNVIYW